MYVEEGVPVRLRIGFTASQLALRDTHLVSRDWEGETRRGHWQQEVATNSKYQEGTLLVEWYI